MNVELALASVHPLHSHPVRGLDPGHLINANEMSRMCAKLWQSFYQLQDRIGNKESISNLSSLSSVTIAPVGSDTVGDGNLIQNLLFWNVTSVACMLERSLKHFFK